MPIRCNNGKGRMSADVKAAQRQWQNSASKAHGWQWRRQRDDIHDARQHRCRSSRGSSEVWMRATANHCQLDSSNYQQQSTSSPWRLWTSLQSTSVTTETTTTKEHTHHGCQRCSYVRNSANNWTWLTTSCDSHQLCLADRLKWNVKTSRPDSINDIRCTTDSALH